MSLKNKIIPAAELFGGPRYREEDKLAEPVEKQPAGWIVQEFGKPDYKGEYSEWEISVCRVSNEHGQCSYGWPGPDKIILSDAIGDPTRKTVRLARQLANYLCAKLNGEV